MKRHASGGCTPSRGLGGRVLVIFQPHRFTRTQALRREFGSEGGGIHYRSHDFLDKLPFSVGLWSRFVGFRPDIERILRRCPQRRQTLLLSATLPPPVLRLAQRYMVDPVHINLSPVKVTVENIRQSFFTVDEDRKVDFELDQARGPRSGSGRTSSPAQASSSSPSLGFRMSSGSAGASGAETCVCVTRRDITCTCIECTSI